MSKTRGNKSVPLRRHILAGCGWLIILVEWIHVSRQARPGEARTLVLVLITSLLLVHLVAMMWIAHNRGLAARGKRGSTTRYASRAFSQDYLGRPLVIESGSLAKMELDISIDGHSKSYSSTTATTGKLDAPVHGDAEAYISTTA